MTAPVGCSLVRHADAVARASWSEADAARPLTPEGACQADALASALVEPRPDRLLTSPARRCADTLAPLAAGSGATLEDEPLLAEGTDPGAALDRLREVAAAVGPGGRIVACTHGDVIDGVVHLLAEGGTALAGLGGGPVLAGAPKSARWELEVVDGVVRAGRLVGPPASRR
jgi:8-oxo-dGTP diphosphatase